jgi:putative FmdB family regulatory protein
MPLYDYECRRHGPFSDWRAMSLCDEPAPCPRCGKAAQRSVSAPALGIDPGLRKAHRINEKAAEEPRVVRRRRGDPIPHDAHRDLTAHRGSSRDRHAGHAHVHDHGKPHAHVSKHPWMIRH